MIDRKSFLIDIGKLNHNYFYNHNSFLHFSEKVKSFIGVPAVKNTLNKWHVHFGYAKGSVLIVTTILLSFYQRKQCCDVITIVNK